VHDVVAALEPGWVERAVDHGLADVLAAADADRLAPYEVIRPLAEQSLRNVLRRLVGEDAEPDRSAAQTLARDIVARDVDLHQVTTLLRTLQHDWLRELAEHAVAQGAAAVVPDVARELTASVDGWVETFVEAVLDERRRRLDTGHVRARAVVEAVVAGEPVDVESGSALLGVPLDGPHVACVVAARAGAALTEPAVRAVVRSLVGPVLRYETATGQVWLWASATRGDPTGPDPVQVGLGGPHDGVAGMRRAHLEAREALRVGALTGSPVTAYADVALAALLSQDEERARWYVAAELGALAAPDAADLRDTLRAFFGTRMRVAPAAEQLFVHRNTFINRLERIERLLGHPVAERTAEVQAALLLHELPRQ
jgi:hypothetical protein